MKTINKAVACTPYPSREVKIETKGGLPVVKQFKELTKLTVVFNTDDESYFTGDEVFVRGDSMKHPHATEIYELDGVLFVLVPYEFVKLVNRKEEW
jgi:hypothetical protein